MQERWYFLGSGHMARAFIQGLIKIGISKQQIFASSLTGFSSKRLQEELGVNHVDSPIILGASDICVLALKPQQFHALDPQVFKFLDPNTTIISLLAGVDSQTLKQKTQAKKIIRHMPNLAVALREQGACSVMSEAVDQDYFCTLFDKLGHHTLLNDEQLMTDSTVHCSSMLAHHFHTAHLIAQDLERLGFDSKEARALSVMTFQAAASLMQQSDLPLLELKEKVVSKAGVTYAFLKSLEDHDFAGHFKAALKAGQQRARELQDQSKGSM